MRVRTVLVRVLSFAIPLTAIGAGIPVLRAEMGSRQARSARTAAQPSLEVAVPSASAPAPAPPAPPPAQKRHAVMEDLFSIWVPPGWSGGEIDNPGIGSGGYDAKRVWRYEDADGRFFVVAVDPDGSDWGYDEFWHYHVKDGAFRIVDVFDDCVHGPDDPFCSRGDGRFDIFVIQQGGGSAIVHGHAYYFMAGHANEERSDGPYREMLESIRPH